MKEKFLIGLMLININAMKEKESNLVNYSTDSHHLSSSKELTEIFEFHPQAAATAPKNKEIETHVTIDFSKSSETHMLLCKNYYNCNNTFNYTLCCLLFAATGLVIYFGITENT